MSISITHAFEHVRQLLSGLDNCRMESSELVRFVTGATRSDLLIGQRTVTKDEYDRLLTLALQRQSGYPLQYILGEWAFYGLPFKVGEGVLIPRSDTEILVEKALEAACGRDDLRILDLCSGSGCIAITIKTYLPNSLVYALEKSPVAISYIERNTVLNNAEITVLQDDALKPQCSADALDMILSNPPYLTSDDMEALQREVTYEPKMALYGESDGLHFYRELTRIWRSRLKAGGVLMYEVGHTQANEVAQILAQNGFDSIRTFKDLHDISRVISGRWRPAAQFSPM